MGTPSSSQAEDTSWLEQVGQLVAILVVAAVVAAATITVMGWIKVWNLPFCDTNAKSQGDCIPCPENGICQGGKLQCLTGFKKRGRTCVEDKYVDKSADKLARTMKDHVCRVNGISVCNGAGVIWLTEDELLAVLSSSSRGPDSWLVEEKAMVLVTQMLDVKSLGVNVFTCPPNLVNAYKPLGCKLREWIYRNFLKMLVLLPLAVAVSKFLWKRWRRSRNLARAEELYLQVCEALEEKATLQAPGNEPWIVASRLRDHLLRPSERKNRSLWMEVERLVQEDSRIDQYRRLVKGDSRIVWEWQVEGALSPATLRKRRGEQVTPVKLKLET